MEIEIDLKVVPPNVVLHNSDDFKSFSIVVDMPQHAWVPIAVLEQLMGNRADDPEWRTEFEKMLKYAQQRGFFDDRGIRAHIEHRS